MAAQKLLHIVYSNIGDKHYYVFLFEAHLLLRDWYGTLVLKRQNKTKSQQPQTSNNSNNNHQPHTISSPLPSPQYLSFGGKRRKKQD